jgi:hypothetical protein
MRFPALRCRWLGLVVAVSVLTASAAAGDEANLTKEQITRFLLTAKVIESRRSSKGVTSPWRLTLSDGRITHDASFQNVDEHKVGMQFSNGRSELMFVDSYKYNLAAYRLAQLLALDDILPVYVERKWKGYTGSLSWWLPVKMDEGERLKRKIEVPGPEAWNKRMYMIRVFDELIYDTDTNLTNVLIGNDWKAYRVDFTRAFRLNTNLKEPRNLVRCDRKLLEKLKALDENELAQSTRRYLNRDELKAVLARRDKIVAYFQKLIAQKGEAEVLY